MPDPAQLPYLLRLLDDDDEPVRQSVAAALAAFGPSLTRELARVAPPPDEAQMRLIRELLGVHRGGESVAAETTEAGQLFATGQLVRHRRYDYRGVIVAFDLTCQAQDEWYFANRTQPDRYQRWYHVLVHGSQQVTYAAQTSLQADDSGHQVIHPLVERFFSSFEDGRYVRNDEPWGPS